MLEFRFRKLVLRIYVLLIDLESRKIIVRSCVFFDVCLGVSDIFNLVVIRKFWLS